jgi:hypothetical protein
MVLRFGELFDASPRMALHAHAGLHGTAECRKSATSVDHAVRCHRVRMSMTFRVPKARTQSTSRHRRLYRTKGLTDARACSSKRAV